MEQIVDDYITQGYESVSTGENSALLRKKAWGTAGGHVLCFVLTFWTVGLGNVAYALICRYTAEQVLVRITESPS